LHKEEAMNVIRLSAVVVALLVATIFSAVPNAWAQQKRTLSFTESAIQSRYLQEHAIDVGDIPGHQIRVYELHFVYPHKDLVFDGVAVKESWTKGASDYTNWNGTFSAYAVYLLEDENKIFSRVLGATQSTINPDGSRGAFRFTYIENLMGGTGRFKGIRGQIRGIGERAVGATSISQQSQGEYWIE
jgi:hypothetical protein